jgi:response regulator RpfG family c-di-GMP phosphodiesterase
LDGKKNFPVFIGIVDDERDLLYLFRDALSQIPNVRVFAFSDPLLALEHFQYNHKNYRCIISDYRMPELNGVQLLSKVKQINREVTTMLISAFEIEDELFKSCGCVDKFLQKPITISNLVSAVQEYVGIMEIQKEEN